MPTKTRYAITYVGKHELRQLAFSNQGRHHFDTAPEAHTALVAFLGPEGLCKVLTPEQVKTLRVDPITCYDHGDAIGIYVRE